MTRVYSAPSSISGLGLFASEDFSKGDEVISFKAKTITKFEWRDKCLSLPIPEDAAFVFNGKMLYDPKFVPNQAIPMWYYFNHSSNPNTRMRKQGATVVWYAIRSIASNEELTFDYGEPDPSWS